MPIILENITINGSKIRAAYEMVPELIKVSIAHLFSQDLSSYHKFFEKDGTSKLEFVKNVFYKLDDWVKNKTITFFNTEILLSDLKSRPNSTSDPDLIKKTDFFEKAVAYVFLLNHSDVDHVGSGVRIGVQNRFLDACNNISECDFAGVIIHELTHKIGKEVSVAMKEMNANIINSITDICYYESACLALASDPNKTIYNADSYRCFVKDTNKGGHNFNL